MPVARLCRRLPAKDQVGRRPSEIDAMGGLRHKFRLAGVSSASSNPVVPITGTTCAIKQGVIKTNAGQGWQTGPEAGFDSGTARDNLIRERRINRSAGFALFGCSARGDRTCAGAGRR